MKLGALGLAALGRRSPTGSAASSPRPAIVVSFLYTGSAMATTAIGTLIPILRDNGELKTRFGTYLLAAGGAGEFGPILLVTLVLSTDQPAARGGDPDRLRRPGAGRSRWSRCAAPGAAGRRWNGPSRRAASSRCGSPSSSSSASSCSPSKLGLDLLLGGFVAGMITRAGAAGARAAGLRVEADRGRLRLLRPLLLRHQRHRVRPRRARLGRSDRQAGAVLRPLPGRPRRAGAAALPRRARAPATAPRSPSTRRPSCRSSSRSRRSRSTPATCSPRPPPAWSARRCSRPWSSPSSAWPCARAAEAEASEAEPPDGAPPRSERARRPAGPGRLAPPDQLQALVDGRLGACRPGPSP